MFNLFKKQPTVDTPESEINTYNKLSKNPAYPTYAAGVPVPEAENNDAVYTVGVNQAGETQLRINNKGSVSMTLTMSPQSVAMLIKQLAVTIEDEYDVDVDKI
jgi:hypothetical protein